MPSTDMNSHVVIWRKSRHSMNAGACVEVARVASGLLIRDSANTEGCVIACPAAAWQAFVATLRS
ncbi:MAG TPA: DUF397 domain-containing protein [Trebonia sp.]|nr:DUF397 domain-containing protein [Trebonia sp.]